MTEAQTIDDVTLAALALDFDHSDNRRLWDEVEERARSGQPGLQRFIAHVGLRLWAHSQLSTEQMLEQAEPFARAVARTGRDGDLELLASILSIRADYHRERGEDALAHSAEVEALTLIGSVANGTDDPVVAARAAQDFNEMAKGFSPCSRTQAEAELWVRGVVFVDQRAEPEVEVMRKVKG